MPGYVNVFTGDAVQPQEVSYRAVALATSVELAWPTLSENSADVASRIMDVTAAAPGLVITLPPADQVGVGADAMFNNVGASSFDVVTNTGGAVVTIAAGVCVYLYLTDNSTPGGTWRVMVFGATTSLANAATLAGAGLGVVGGQLIWGPHVQTLTSSPQIFGFGGLGPGIIYRWTGGALAATLGAAGASGSGFTFGVRNDGSGVLTFTAAGGDTVDGNATQTLAPGDSAFFLSDGANTWTVVGLGRLVSNVYTFLVKDITAGGIINLTAIEAANKIIKLVGVPASNASVNVPAVPSIYWFNEATTGANLIFAGITGVGNNILQLPQGHRMEVVCDGANVYTATDLTVGSFTFAFGAIGAPAIAFSGSTLGFYHDAVINRLNFTVDGVRDLLYLGATGITAGAGTTLNAIPLTIAGYAPVAPGVGGDVAVVAGNALTSGVGGQVFITAGSAAGAQTGGAVQVTGGIGGSGGGAGGTVALTGGAPLGAGGFQGGAVNLTGGAGSASVGSAGGFLNLVGGASTTYQGGDVRITGGQGGVPISGIGSPGGNVLITAGAPGNNNSTASAVQVVGALGGAASGPGGPITMTGGNAATSGAGGAVTITGGKGGSSTGAAGAINIVGGAGGAAFGAGAGGDVNITGGSVGGGGGGQHGGSVIITPGVGPTAIFNIVQLNGIVLATNQLYVASAIGSGPNQYAALQVDGISKAFVPPRMTTAQRSSIFVPIPGMIIFNTTTGKLNMANNSGVWEQVTSV